MEFFLPGLAALLITALIVFLVLPRLGAPILAVLSIVLLGYGVYNHYYMFYNEYRYSTWQERLKWYAPFLLLGGLILAILGYMGFLFGTSNQSVLPASNLPADNQVVDAVNTVGNGALEGITNFTNAIGITNNAKVNNNRGVISNLGNILSTPTPQTNNNRSYIGGKRK